MPYVACPSCGERGKIPPSLLGSRIKCKKCGLSFNVAPPVAKATATAAPAAVGVAAVTVGPVSEGIAVEGLDAAAWTAPDDHGEGLRVQPEADHAAAEATDGSSKFVAHEVTSVKEYKVLTSKDKIFDGKFDLGRLEEALNHFAREGWVVKAMSNPQVKNFTGGMQEEIVIILERRSRRSGNPHRCREAVDHQSATVSWVLIKSSYYVSPGES